ncbi:auxin transporter-like protein 2 [Elaeis guineensis]|uniref:auxin transporter-like protein 2 n=1 Tax=Elaeis guineensis var. tenera TaxID=51953 RepID=UPI003C6D5266
MIFSLTGRIKTREAIVGSFNETKQDGNGKKQEERSEEPQPMFSMKSLLWQAGSVWDAWFSCASNQTCMRAGGPSSADAAVLVLAAGDAVRRAAPAALRRAPNRKEKENVSFKNHVIQWFEVLDGLPGPCWKAFDCTFLHFGSVIQLIACARHTCSSSIFQSNPTSGISSKPQIKVIKSGPSLDSDKAPG